MSPFKLTMSIFKYDKKGVKQMNYIHQKRNCPSFISVLCPFDTNKINNAMEKTINRRKMIAGMGAGFATLAINPVFQT